ncbi:MAG: hypothetical protein AB7K68_16365 [Bacteriovoracia bacterium]
MACLLPFKAQAGTVRTIGVSDSAMTPIYLKRGKSTVLRFTDKPRKVVVGNQNYYSIEFIENDLAIQPLGSVATNLFVYTESRTYGFLLTPGERYDDLVFVRWKFSGERIKGSEKALPEKESHPHLSFKIGKAFKVTVERVKTQSALGLHLIDCIVENTGKAEIALSKAALQAMRRGARLDKQEVVFEKDKLKPKEKSKARLVLKLDKKADFTLEGKFGSESGKVILGRKFL